MAAISTSLKAFFPQTNLSFHFRVSTAENSVSALSFTAIGSKKLTKNSQKAKWLVGLKLEILNSRENVAFGDGSYLKSVFGSTLSSSVKTKKASFQMMAMASESESGSEEKDKKGVFPTQGGKGEREREGSGSPQDNAEEGESGSSPSEEREREGEGEGEGEGEDEGERDWRIFRAKLVAQSQSEAGFDLWEPRLSLPNQALLSSQSPLLAKEAPWAHATWHPEKGGILLAGPAMNLAIDERYWQSVVFLVQHAADGSWGVILNRPSGYCIQEALAASEEDDKNLSPFAGNPIYIGGFRSDGRSMYLLHGHKLKGAEEIVPGVYMGGLEAASKEVREGRLPPMDFRFFVGRVAWLGGRLSQEVDRKEWHSAACSRSLVLKQCLRLPTPLWKEILELMGGEYAAAAQRAYGELP